jgi:hypothetical protein
MMGKTIKGHSDHRQSRYQNIYNNNHNDDWIHFGFFPVKILH